MTAPIFTSEEQVEIKSQARRRGFAGAREYIRLLLKQDAQAHSETVGLQPTLNELMSMPAEERSPYLDAAAAPLEEKQRTEERVRRGRFLGETPR